MSELEGHAVGCENIEGGELATQHLLRLGRRRIAYIGSGSDDHPEFRDRFTGYCLAHERAGVARIAELATDTENQETEAFAATQELLDRGLEFDAIFAASDLIAFGAIKCLRHNGIKVPEQVSVVGFDDIPAATYFSPSLSTVRQDTRLAAEALTDNLLQMIAGEEVTSSLVPISIVVRGSCGGRKVDS